ncbi:DNA gyrase inhibitor YacG [Oceanobacter sp. 5_MG-2023]|uniref:DNA gyrase inhibitor YacG n=1 Tax=Oceanobacter sp. 5_MG-2023 TaxID=3062645 RepID=UPI0026E36118|nr:DNA gyrase inhibitor YacG [Oceanobacter sp. 5_MG-2023]MDO6681305.1 DNA gyrase inhibitor YacG [Oceanobacter sp. 5_MG-2023]
MSNSPTATPTTSHSAANDAVLAVECPTCQKSVPWTAASRFRPFCCERCQLIDLGEWASESHRIPGSQDENDLMSDELY